MTILSQGYCGRTLVCAQCYSLLAFNEKDIYDKKYIYCPLCKYKNEIPLVVDVEARPAIVKKDSDEQK